MKYIVSIFIFGLMACSSSQKGVSLPSMKMKAASTKNRGIETAKDSVKKEDFCYSKKNRDNKRCQYTLLSKAAEKVYILNSVSLREVAKEKCPDKQSLRVPRITGRYLKARSHEDAVGRLANLAVKKGSNTLFVVDVSPSLLVAESYDCPPNMINEMIQKGL